MKFLLTFLFFLSASASAACDFTKAARNKVLDEKIGVSGSCNTEKALRNKVSDSTDNRPDKEVKAVRQQISDQKNKVENSVNRIKTITDNSVNGNNKASSQ